MKAAQGRWRAAPSPTFAGESRTSPFRDTNEDRILMRPGLAAVVDGMGGHSDGAAAATAIVAALAALHTVYEDDVCAALLTCDRMLRGEMGRTSGATAAALLWHEARYVCLWAGDCRIYLWRAGALVQTTHDHRLVQQLIDAGALSADAARSHPQASVITGAIGAGDCEIARNAGAIEPNDRFLICSDGLSDVVGNDEIAACLCAASPQAAVSALHQAATPFARDDVSIVVVDPG